MVGQGTWVPPERFHEYQLVEALGRGSMGQVWIAHDSVLDRLVAVKFLVALPERDGIRQRLLTEARAAARVQHPNIIAVYRVGEIGARPYLVSEYVRGISLDKIARPVSRPQLRAIARGLARGLAAAHHHGVLHRDLKPANAILSETGDVKLLDFGLAKLFHPAARRELLPAARAAGALRPDLAMQATNGPPGSPSDPTIDLASRPRGLVRGELALPEHTPAGAVMGTPAYMAPEIWRGEPATPRSDVYSLGALLYALAAGAPPARAPEPEPEDDAASVATAAPGIDRRFAAVVDRCLRRDPAERFASGAAVLEALEAAPGRWRVVVDRAGRLTRRLAFTGGIAVALAMGPSAAVAPASCLDGMVAVPAGTFEMGSRDGLGDEDEHPRHEVTLSGYCIDRTEVTVRAYTACIAASGCTAAAHTVLWPGVSADAVTTDSQFCNHEDRPDHPMNCVDWNQATAYCRWAGRRLPTEAEWEYAARGTDGRRYPWGNEAPSATRLNGCGTECVAWAQRVLNAEWARIYDASDGWPTTAPVGSFPAGASAFGALDMSGNVSEWTADWYGAYPAHPEVNPRGAEGGSAHVNRGAGWSVAGAGNVSTSNRFKREPEVRLPILGFRCAAPAGGPS